MTKVRFISFFGILLIVFLFIPPLQALEDPYMPEWRLITPLTIGYDPSHEFQDINVTVEVIGEYPEKPNSTLVIKKLVVIAKWDQITQNDFEMYQNDILTYYTSVKVFTNIYPTWDGYAAYTYSFNMKVPTNVLADTLYWGMYVEYYYTYNTSQVFTAYDFRTSIMSPLNTVLLSKNAWGFIDYFGAFKTTYFMFYDEIPPNKYVKHIYLKIMTYKANTGGEVLYNAIDSIELKTKLFDATRNREGYYFEAKTDWNGKYWYIVVETDYITYVFLVNEPNEKIVYENLTLIDQETQIEKTSWIDFFKNLISTFGDLIKIAIEFINSFVMLSPHFISVLKQLMLFVGLIFVVLLIESPTAVISFGKWLIEWIRKIISYIAQVIEALNPIG